MKKIIGGKKYDTETAELIHEFGNEYFANDFECIVEALYRKRTGEYFLYGWGGAKTHYAKQVEGNNWCGGDAIMPLTYEEARAWMEEHATADKYEAAFGEVSEGGKDTAVTFRISASARERLRKTCEQTGRSQSTIIESLIETL